MTDRVRAGRTRSSRPERRLGEARQAPVKTESVLYHGPGPEQARRFLDDLQEAAGARLRVRGGVRHLSWPEGSLAFTVRHDREKALRALRAGYFNLIVLDLRAGEGRRQETARTLQFLDALDREPDVEMRYSFDRILALVSGEDPLEVDELIRSLGTRGVGRVVRQVLHGPQARSGPAYCRLVLGQVLDLTRRGRHGGLALCLAGGGITGIYFEMGVLKCLADCLPAGALNRFDSYFGISAGAVVGGLLANGFTVEEAMAALDGHQGGRIPPTSLSLLRPGHLNLAGLSAPLAHLARGLTGGVRTLLAGRNPLSLESLALDYTDLFTAPFDASGFEAMLRELFAQEGATNDFRRLRRRLYVGVTDQDRREHVLLGQAPDDEVEISRAIQASVSINPFFCSTRIGRRHFVDGALTRTSNFVEAIRKGSHLIFAVDPFVPYVARRAGFSATRGVIYNADQDVRTLSFTRFETTRHWVLRRHPEVSMYAFLPANRVRALMSVNPMDHRPYLEIWRGAYLSAYRRLRRLRHRLDGDLRGHGLRLDLRRAEAVSRRLARARRPALGDFFPDGRIELGRPEEPGLRA